MAPFTPPTREAGGEPAAAPMAAGSRAWSKEEDVPSVAGLQGLSLRSFKHGEHGTKAVLAHVGGPLCSAAMVFATEASDNKGLVHCLEHLCFMGSQKYPKGYLDFLATRCGCEGTNAYTEADHTCFEFEAAGQVGLLAVLPVFVDHVLCPALTDDAFTTEIHHVNGKGERQGVVFSEMLGRVTDEEEMLDLERRRAVFGDASPYSFEHGGLPDLILKLTKAEIAAYHRQVYTTDNLSVVVAGTFDDDSVLAALGDALDKSVSVGGAGQRCELRPFIQRLPALPSSCPRRKTVTFPSDDISLGTVAYSHRLDGIAFDNVYSLVALDCLGRYLEGLASSPLEQAFVQCEPPVATGVTCNIDDTAEPHFTIELRGVPFRPSTEEQRAAKKMGGGRAEGDEGDGDAAEDNESEDEEEDEEEEQDEEDDDEDEEEDVDEDDGGPDWFSGDALLQRLVDALRKVRDALRAGEEDASKELQRAIKKETVTRRVNFEDGPSEVVRQSLLSSLIFERYPGAASHRDGVLEAFAAEAAALEELPAKPSSWWADLLERQMLRPLEATLAGAAEAAAAAEVRACPSAIMCLQNERKEEREAKKNAKALGKKKLKALQERVDAAEEANRCGLDEEMQASFPPPVTPGCVPDFSWEMERFDAPKEGGVEVLEVEVSSGFVELSVSWQLGDATQFQGRAGAELRAYLNLFSALVCETDVASESYKSVVARLDDELVSYSASVGCGTELLQASKNPHPVTFGLKLSSEPEKTANMVTWADRLAHECEFPEEKVLSTCKRLITSIKGSMRDGGSVLSTVTTTMLHGTLSPQVQFCSLEQRPFLERCVCDIAGTCAALRRLRDVITAPSTAALAVISGSTRESRCATRDMLQEAFRARHASVRPSLLEAVKWGAGARPSAPPLLPLRHLVVGCAGADTADVHLSADLPTPPLVLDARKSGALRLLCEALSMMEGALSMAVRGKGLAYGASVSFLPTENAVSLDLWECTNVKKAVEAALEVIRDAAECDSLAPFQLDNARGALVFSLKGKRATPTSVVGAAVGSAHRGWRSAAEVLEWENAMASVTEKDVLAVHEEYLKVLCDAASVRACVVCDPGDCKKMAKGLAGALGLNAKQVFVKDNIADCYEIVDGKVRDAYAKLDA